MRQTDDFGGLHKNMNCAFPLKDQIQNFRISNIFSALQNILLGVPQGFILGPILFNIFLIDLFLYIKKSDLHNLRKIIPSLPLVTV